MAKFETKIQYLKYQVLKEVAKQAWEDNLVSNVLDIPKKIIPGKTPTMRCCVYKERAILQERVKLAMGGDLANLNKIEVIDIACDECPLAGYEVTNTCRGCLAQKCHDACKRDAIYYDKNHQAHIDKEKCVNCGACSKVCPYTAIVNRKRPCENACKINAMETNENKATVIKEEKCIRCGACISQCPFGAIMDKSYILDCIDYLRKSNQNKNFTVNALIAPSIYHQFDEGTVGQVITGLKELGFGNVVEVAIGADMVAKKEVEELVEKGFLISSCCPAFVLYIKKNYPDLMQYVSTTQSPMVTIGKYLKEKEPNCKNIFIGPCTAKKQEHELANVKDYIDVVLTYEELQALFDSKKIDLSTRNETEIDNGSIFGRGFATSQGLTNAMKQGLQELGHQDFELKAEVCNGIEACKIALLKKSKNVLDANFIEGMACVGGCIGGAGVIDRGLINMPTKMNDYYNASKNETIVKSLEKNDK